MMYRFKKEKMDTLIDGRTITYIAEKLGMSREHLRKILANEKECDKKTAIVISSFDDFISDLRLEERINYYFELTEDKEK